MKTKLITALTAIIAAFAIAACDATLYRNPQTNVTFYTGSLGGRKTIGSVAVADGFSMTGYEADMEKSFRDGMLAAGVIGASVANSIATKASEETAQAAIAADAKTKAAASDAALQKALAAEETKRLGMELEAGAAAVIPPTP